MVKTYKQQIVESAIQGMKDGGWDLPEVLKPLLEQMYESGYRECIRNIKEKQTSPYSDKYSDIMSDGGMDPRL